MMMVLTVIVDELFEFVKYLYEARQLFIFLKSPSNLYKRNLKLKEINKILFKGCII